MRIATRLLLAIVTITTTVMLVYGVISLRERESILRDALIRETETLATTIQIVTDNALRDARFDDLDRVLERLADDPETLIAAVLDADGRTRAGVPSRIPDCVPGLSGLAVSGSEGAQGWIDCDGRVRYVAVPLRPPASLLVVGRRATVLERDAAASRVRILLTTLIMATAAAGSIVVLLRGTLSKPLSAIMRGVRTAGGPRMPPPVDVPRSAGELREFALAFNAMTERMQGKREALIEEVEERLTLERQLRRSEKFAALGRLTGGLAHELGSPLNAIEVRAEAIEADLEAPRAARRHARAIVAEVDRITELVRGLHHIARRHRPEPRPVNLVDIVQLIHEQVREEADAHSIELYVVAPSMPATVSGDATLLRHALTHLVRNAIQALASHSGERLLRIRVSEQSDRVLVSVEDSGPGIPPAHLPRLFEPFFTTKDVGEGCGLGLAIAQGIAEEHDGTLRIDSLVSQGTKAVLELPRIAPE